MTDTETSGTADSNPRHHETKQEDRVPFLQKIAIGAGEMSSVGRQGLEHLALPIFNIVLLVNPVLVTSVLAFARLWDAITDPLAGFISDNTRSRWGRRKPYLVVSSIICGLTFPIIWFLPGNMPEYPYFLHLLLTALVYFTAYSFFNVPLIALAFEVSPDYHERTRVQSYKAIFVHAMGFLSAGLFYIVQRKEYFDNELQGARVVGIILGLFVMVVGLIPALTVKERYREVVKKEENKLSFFAHLRETLTNRPFLMIVFIGIGNGLANGMVQAQAMGLYIMVYHVYGGDTFQGGWLYWRWFGVYQAMTIVSIPLVAWLATRFNKLFALKICLFTLIIASLSKWFTFTPELPNLALVTAILLGPGQTAFYICIRSILADICDHDELHTGQRREGMFGSMHSWLGKAVGSIASILSGLILVWVGFNAALGGNQDPDTIFYMRAAFTCIPVIGTIIALVILHNYPLTEAKSREIRQELEKRRGADYVE